MFQQQLLHPLHIFLTSIFTPTGFVAVLVDNKNDEMMTMMMMIQSVQCHGV